MITDPLSGESTGDWWDSLTHYSDVITSAMAPRITSVSIVCPAVCSGADQRKRQSSASLAFVRGVHRRHVSFPAQRTSNAENVSIWWRHHEKFNNTEHASTSWHRQACSYFVGYTVNEELIHLICWSRFILFPAFIWCSHAQDKLAKASSLKCMIEKCNGKCFQIYVVKLKCECKSICSFMVI